MPRTFPPSDCQSVRFVLYWISYSGKTRSCPAFVTAVGQVSSSRGPLEVRTIGKGSAAGPVPQSDEPTSPMSESLIGVPAFMPHCNHKIWFLVKRKPRSRRRAFYLLAGQPREDSLAVFGSRCFAFNSSICCRRTSGFGEDFMAASRYSMARSQLPSCSSRRAR